MHLNWLAHSMLQAQSYVNCVLNKMHLRFQIHFKHYKILLGRPRGGTRGQLGAQGHVGGCRGCRRARDAWVVEQPPAKGEIRFKCGIRISAATIKSCTCVATRADGADRIAKHAAAKRLGSIDPGDFCAAAWATKRACATSLAGAAGATDTAVDATEGAGGADRATTGAGAAGPPAAAAGAID